MKEFSGFPLSRIGGLSYRNAAPLQRGLHPAPRLYSSAGAAKAFATGEVDVALIPWAAVVASGWESNVVPGTGIAADGPVFSVFVTWPAGCELAGPVLADPASRSSSALFEILRSEFQFFGAGMPPLVDPGESTPPDRPRLLIGDEAIRFRRRHSKDWKFLDLSEAWHTCTGLPFVFAVWVARKDPAGWEERLAGVRDRNLAAIQEWTQGWEDLDFWLSYYAGLRYRLGPREVEGMQLFRTLAISGRSIVR